MALFNGYQSTYMPSSSRGGMPDANSSPFQNPLYQSADYMQAAAAANNSGNTNATPTTTPSTGTGSQNPTTPGLGSPQTNSSNPLGVNFNPGVTNVWATPGKVQVGSNPAGSENGFNSAMDLFNSWRTGQDQGPQSSPIMSQLPFANPFDPVANQFQNALSNQGKYSQYGTGDVATNPQNGFQSQNGQFFGADKGGNPLFQNTAAGTGGYLNGTDSVTQFAPWGADQIFNSFNPDQLSAFNSAVAPGQLQTAYSQAAQNSANAFANPQFQSINNYGTDQNQYNSWLSQSYNDYVGKMNQFHQF